MGLHDDMGRVIGLDPPRGRATLNGLTAVPVACPSITATSLIFITIRVPVGSLGIVWVASITAGVGFSLGTIALNTSEVSWMVID